jgi:phenylpropionate dioxygenase-like ring-hydroxylating dioxygenase large terminal subunit
MRTNGMAYEKRPGTYRKELTEVSRGTPMGELLRRYWHPVARIKDATSTPKQVRVLGEDLVLFRDGQGRPGLVHARCAHRGTTLYYGKVEERGIRCCYHGWLYDVEGRCLEQPCEPELGARTRDKVRQPWYPARDLYDLVFAYMGPPEKIPVLPRYECLENLEEGEVIEAPDPAQSPFGNLFDPAMPCNWLQQFENMADPYHVPVLHGSFSGTHFAGSTTQMPLDAEFRMSPRGVEARTNRPMGDGRVLYRISEAVLPTICVVANPFAPKLDEPVTGLSWIMPIDDTHQRVWMTGRRRAAGPPGEGAPGFFASIPDWSKMTGEERRARPGDWEAQTGQGPITLHSEEHLTSSDKGVIMVRKMLNEQLKRLARGEDPINVSFDPDSPPVKLSGGNCTGSAETAARKTGGRS